MPKLISSLNWHGTNHSRNVAPNTTERKADLALGTSSALLKAAFLADHDGPVPHMSHRFFYQLQKEALGY